MGLRERLRREQPPATAPTAPAAAPHRTGLAPVPGIGDTGGRLAEVAVITMVRDEAVMLPRWVAHYSAQVGTSNLLVIDDSSTDGSTDDLPCPVLRIPPLRKKDFEPARMDLLSSMAASLLAAYDAVIFADADEFILADPARHQSLRHYVTARPGRNAVAALGLNVVHDAPRESVLDPGRPILQQRSLAKLVPLMCKPAVQWVGARWMDASHGIRTQYQVDSELFMFHMKFADRDLLQQAADHRRRMVDMDGRAAATSWSKGGDEMVSLLGEITAGVDPAQVPELVAPSGAELEALVTYEDRGYYRSPRGGQVPMMRKRPFVRIPPRFRDAL